MTDCRTLKIDEINERMQRLGAENKKLKEAFDTKDRVHNKLNNDYVKLREENNKLKENQLQCLGDIERLLENLEEHYDVDDYPEEVPPSYWWAHATLKEVSIG